MSENTQPKKQHTQKSTTDKVLFIIGIVLIVLMLPLLILDSIIIIKGAVNKDHVPGVFGSKPLVVISDSMDPTIKKNDLIMVKSQDLEKRLAESSDPINELNGEVIAYKYYENGSWTVITHRIKYVIKGAAEIENYRKINTDGTPGEYYAADSKPQGDYYKQGVDYSDFKFIIDTNPEGYIVANAVDENGVPGKLIRVSDGSDYLIRTQGDYSGSSIDNWYVSVSDVEGVWQGFRIGGVGNLVDFLTKPLGLIIFLGVPIIAIVAYDLISVKLQAKKAADAKNAELEEEIKRLKAEKERKESEEKSED